MAQGKLRAHCLEGTLRLSTDINKGSLTNSLRLLPAFIFRKLNNIQCYCSIFAPLAFLPCSGYIPASYLQ